MAKKDEKKTKGTTAKKKKPQDSLANYRASRGK